MLRRALLLLVAAIALFLLLSRLGPAWDQYNPISGAWQGEEIVYYNASEYEASLREAIDRWESVGIPLRFRETKTKSEAHLVIYSGRGGLYKKCSNKKCSGWATIGYSSLRRAEVWLLPPSHPFEKKMKDFVMLPTILHEIGHVLGLSHNEHPCSIMSNSSFNSCRSVARTRITASGKSMLCGPWEKDIEDLQKLYPEVKGSPPGKCVDPLFNKKFFNQNHKQILEQLRNFQQAE